MSLLLELVGLTRLKTMMLDAALIRAEIRLYVGGVIAEWVTR
jgi:hypothetical protein